MIPNKTIVQSTAKAAVKTFLQAFFGVLLLLAVPTLTNWAVSLQNGGDVEIDVKWFTKVLIAAIGGGIAALISFIWNSLLKGSSGAVIAAPPVAVDE